MMTYDSFFIKPCDKDQIYVPLIIYIIETVKRAFNFEKKQFRQCLIDYTYNGLCPKFFNNAPLLIIILNLRIPIFWPKVTFQLSHELCHYYLFNYKENSYNSISWFEETICEAFSLLILFTLMDLDRQTIMDIVDPSFRGKLFLYLNNELSQETNKTMRECRTQQQLKVINEKSQEKREDRRFERNIAYEGMKKYPNDIKCILYYEKYINDDKITINFNKWKEDEPENQLIPVLEMIHPIILV